MAIININKGTAANNGTGTTAREGADIINANFNYLDTKITSLEPDISKDQLITGGLVWDSVLGKYKSLNLSYKINGDTFIIVDGTTVDTPAYPTTPGNTKIVYYYGNYLGELGATASDEDVTPISPTLEPYELLIHFAILSEGSTAPDGITKTTIFTENAGQPTEWDATESTSGARIEIANTTTPITGTYSIRTLGSVNNGDTISFTHTTPVTRENFQYVQFDIKCLAVWGSNNYISLRLKNGGTIISSRVVSSDYIDVNNITTTQTITVFKDVFPNLSAASFDTLEIWCRKTSGLQFQLDNIYIGEDAGGAQPIAYVEEAEFDGIPKARKDGQWVDLTVGVDMEYLTFACSDEDTDLIVADAVLTFRMPYAMTLTSLRANVKTAPTGANIIVDINENGTTILSTLLSIDATEKTSTTATTPVVISDTSLADDAEITIDITQIGSTIAGTGLKLTFIGTRT